MLQKTYDDTPSRHSEKVMNGVPKVDAANDAASATLYLSSVCRIFTTRTPPNHSRPWAKERNIHTSGSGFVIDGHLILTNAHCISYASVIKVQRHLSDEKVVARVVRVSYDCDVAVLTVDAPDFWYIADPENPDKKVEIPPLQFGPLPELQDVVRVIG